ncbi:MAG: peptide/nickel transport system substrate-binding protein [Parcubacteria bacterium C7867-001]|nr:MAG: peptide/nickel transport system substrate-binding protein [Parcubacteria bacterium C7867-001]
MFERLSRFFSSIRVPFAHKLESFLEKLSAGDKLIAGVLAGFAIAASLGALYALESSFLIEKPTDGGKLTEGIVGSPRFVNPLLAISDTDRDLSSLTYAGLMGEGTNGALVPVLAESYEVSEDGTVYTFIMKSGVRFSDGTPVTADDVVFTVEKAQDPTLKSPEFANWANIRAEAVDARTIRFTLPKPYAPFIEDTTLGILPAHLWRTVSDEEFAFSTLMTHPVGAGPFRVSNVHRNGSGIIDRMDLVASREFALGRPHLDSIRFYFFAQQRDLEAALKNGRIESAYGIAKAGAVTAPYAQVFGVFWNGNQNPLFTHIEVRKALSLMTDRGSIVKDALGGFATPVEGPLPPGSGIVVPQSSTTPITQEERVAAATKTLTNNGWKLDTESNTWKNAKSKLELTVTLRTSNVPELKAVATALKEQWAALNVPVSIELYEPGDLTQNVIRPRKYDALLFGMVVGRDADLFAFWDSAERNDPGLNIAMYANKSVDDLLEKMRTEGNAETRKDDLAKASALITADYPAVFTHTPDFVYVIPKGLGGVAFAQIAEPSDRFAGVWGWYRQTERVWPVFSQVSSR